MSRQLFAIALSTEHLQTLTGSTHFYVTSGDGYGGGGCGGGEGV